jgi:hypothetical protein
VRSLEGRLSHGFGVASQEAVAEGELNNNKHEDKHKTGEAY